MFNQDFRSLNATGSFDVYLLNTTTGNILTSQGNGANANGNGNATATVVVDKFSQRAILDANNTADFPARSLVIDLGVTASELQNSIANPA